MNYFWMFVVHIVGAYCPFMRYRLKQLPLVRKENFELSMEIICSIRSLDPYFIRFNRLVDVFFVRYQKFLMFYLSDKSCL